MKKKYLLLLIVFLTTHAIVFGQSYYFKNYQIMNGVSSNTITCITQDKKGFMWFGTRNGLNRFDGATFRIFRNDPHDPLSIGTNSILSLHQDGGEQLWIGTYKGIYLFDPVKEEFRLFDKVPQSEVRFIGSYKKQVWIVAGYTLYKYDTGTGQVNTYVFRNEQVTNLNVSDNGAVWIVSSAGKLKRYDAANDRFSDFDVSGLLKTTADNQIQDVLPVNDSLVFMGTMHQVLLFNAKTYKSENIFKNYKWGNDVQVHEILKRSTHEFWLGTEDGLYIYDLLTGRTNRVQKQYDNPYAITDNVVMAFCKDRQGGIWIGTFFGGINYFSPEYNVFQKYFPNIGEHNLSGNLVHEICSDQYGNLWIGTEDAGINKIDRTTDKIFKFLPGGKGTIAYRNIHGLLAYKDELWIGTYERGLDVMDIPTGRVIKHYTSGKEPGSLKADLIVTIYKDHDDNILLGTWNGLVTYDRAHDNFSSDSFFTMQVQGMHQDDEGTLWIASYGKGVAFHNKKSGLKGTLRYNTNDPNSLPDDYVNSLFEDSHHNLWFCTESGLCRYDKNTGRITRITHESGLGNTQVFKVLEDNLGNLWISSSKGLFCMNLTTNTVKHYTVGNGLLTDQFNYNSAFKAPDGTLFFGSLKGMISFNPAAFPKNYFIPPVYITGLQINNTDVAIGGENSPLKQALTYTREITVDHSSSTLSIDVAALSYSLPQMNEYQYKMEGFDKDWIHMKNNRKIYYTKLPSGTYTFKVKGSNAGEIWNEKITSLSITVLPPFWASTWAYCLYGLVLIAASIFSVRLYHQRTTEKNARKMEILEREKERELYSAKIEFFTNIAHEIRTPLTLIKMPLDKLRKREFDSSEINENLNMMEKNTNRLIDLTNQLLDFRKVEANNVALNFTRTDINDLLKEVFASFKPAAEQKLLNFKLELPKIGLQAFVDTEAIRKVITNLVNNAVKYAEKTVIIKLLPFSSEDTTFRIEVRNDGNLIPYQLKDKIFEPFYRLKETDKQPGTGVGLALARSLAELHKGEIDLKQPEGDFNVFLLTLPIHQDNEIDVNEGSEVPSTGVLEEQVSAGHSNYNTAKPSLLLVEDNREIINFVEGELKPAYNIFKAYDGEQALDLLLKENIQLVVSDIMMPVMDGIALVKRIKQDIQFSHIPVILLTAKNTLDSKIHGLEVGADAYIEKPFAIEHLSVQITNLLTNRSLIKKYFARSPLTQIKGIAYTKTDKDFIETLNQVIYDNIANMQLDVDQLSKLMNMSKPTLYRKIKALSDLTPHELINLTRLKRASELLAEGEHKVADVAHMVGYTLATNFSRDFNKQFGLSPSQYVADIKDQSSKV